MFNDDIYKYLCTAISDGLNIVIAGKGGSGKTTLLRAILNKIPDNISITSNEETAELYSKHGNIIQREIVKNRNKGNILLEDLTRQSLVMSNDAIVIGEIKGAEAMSFFDGISTGHIGYATVHADSSNLVMDRLVTLIKKDILAQQYSDKYLKNLLAQSLDIIIYMKNFKIYELCTVEYVKENEINCSLIFKYDEEKYN
jgi:pilus assembly protein CpaF